MSLNLLAVQDQITAQLATLPQDVYETTAPEDSKLKFDTNGMILPYVVIEFGEMTEMPIGRGIISSKYNVNESYVLVSCVAPTQRAARQVADLVRDKLVGFIPQDAGELRMIGASPLTGLDAKPNRFVSQLGFTFPVNTVW